MIKRYDERILNLLLDRYETSLLSDGKNRRTVNIRQRIDRKNFPEYYNEASLEYEEIHEQLTELERKGLVTLTWKDGKAGHILEACTLQQERIDAAYAYVHRTSKEEKRRSTLALLQQYESGLPVFTAWARERIAQGLSVRQYIDENDLPAAGRVLKLADAVLHNEHDQYLRSFSIAVFHDSKVAEHEISLCASILSRFERSDLPEDLTADEVFEEFGIYRNPTFIFLKGYGIRETYSEGIGIFQDDIAEFLKELTSRNHQERGMVSLWHHAAGHQNNDKDDSQDSAGPDIILTIENLTSYHQWNPSLHTLGEHELVIYLAGYANRAKRALLCALHEQYPQAAFCHFGDIDAGGFRIWKNLAQETHIPIRTYLMDLPTFEHFRSGGRALTPGDRSALLKMEKDPFFAEQIPLFEQMLKENCKIEQESIRQEEEV